MFDNLEILCFSFLEFRLVNILYLGILIIIVEFVNEFFFLFVGIGKVDLIFKVYCNFFLLVLLIYIGIF